jgi:single-stranded-DNA-specific exonuclease
MQSKKWITSTHISASQLRQFSNIHPILAQVLMNRGFRTPAEIRHFLYDKKTTHNPFDMPDMDKAVTRILSAIKQGEKIFVYGDFDADGVTSTVLLVEALKALSAHVCPYIPHRMNEGYGLNTPALVDIVNQGASLVITVDCGIRSVQEVEDMKTADLDIIITDHHSLGSELPDAYAVINPKIDGYAEDMLAGVGVAFKVVQALIMEARNDPFFNKLSDNKNIIPLENLFDLVAIGTVADLMPLNRLENRILVRRGLEVLRQAKRPGIKALLDVAGVAPADVTTTTIGFVIGPRINAAGRLDSAMLAYHLLASPTYEEALIWANQLNALNIERQDITRSAQQKISESLKDQQQDIPLIFASDPSLTSGIVGLVAGRLTEEYFRPAIVLEQGEFESRASCRSIPQFDITQALDHCADLLVRHGGHALAAGFTVINENIPALHQKLLKLASDTLNGQSLVPTLEIDAEIDINQLDESLVNQLSLLEPCGNGNPQPIFMCRDIHIMDCRTVGKDDSHLKLKLSRTGQPPLDAIGFGLGGWARNMPQRIDIAFQLEINEWNGRRTLQANLQDIRAVTRDH